MNEFLSKFKKSAGPTKEEVLGKKELAFYDAKEVIEREVEKHREREGNKNFPEIEYYKDKDKSSVGFKLGKDTDLFLLMTLLNKRLGKIGFNSYYPGFYDLEINGLNVSLQEMEYSGKAIKFSSKRELKAEEIETIVEMYKISSPEDTTDPTEELTNLGVKVFQEEVALGWDYLAGYEEAKQLVKETIIFPLEQSQVYDEIARGTRKNYETNRPRSVLFSGPPGTGKTTMARIIAGEVKASLIYVPVESIMTKWYGESERNLAEIFKQAAKLGDCLVFLDEIDSLATSRENDIHEATRRVLSVLLREIDGFEVGK
ncbi:AAA family ATPase, partial [Microgenomates group bacterium]|nr:AAA family ATPase [Microgenomates group bacterium]